MRPGIPNILRLISAVLLVTYGHAAPPTATFLADTDRRALHGLFGITLDKGIPANCETVKYLRRSENYVGVLVVPPKPDPAFSKYIVCAYSAENIVFRIIGITKQPDQVRNAMVRHFGEPDLKFNLGKGSVIAWTNDTRVIQFVANRSDPDHPQFLVSCGNIKATSRVYDSDDYFKRFSQ